MYFGHGFVAFAAYPRHHQRTNADPVPPLIAEIAPVLPSALRMINVRLGDGCAE